MDRMLETTKEVLGRHRAALRVRAGLTMAQLVQRSGVSKQTLVQAESGHGIQETKLRAIAKGLGVSAADYIGPDLEE